MYSHSYIMPNNMNSMYRNDNSYVTYDNYPYQDSIYQGDDRFFLAPFLVGGLAGTALGYGIANNNQINHGGGCCPGGMMMYPVYQAPMPLPMNMNNSFSNPVTSTNNNFYY